MPSQTQIKTTRAKLGLSQQEFASLLGTDRRQVTRWESQGSRPNGLAGQVLEELLLLVHHQDDVAAERFGTMLRRRLRNGGSLGAVRLILESSTGSATVAA